ncbi:cupin domain-containing protein [Methylocella silvestris]|uniref:Cupin n=1 Tax=Methylocella silvestris TaxID=199596 RepID=A0A2J7TGP4_METSI|nr:cupin domain-containing protein [Methylocella silvestris]PNG25926.1 cupin [Methylocella silvestris]
MTITDNRFPLAPLSKYSGAFRWEGVERRPYKDAAAAPFKAISRQTLASDPRLAGELRYFEIDPGGFSTLERHEHMHVVMALRGSGSCLIGDAVYALGAHDLVTIEPMIWHQFRARRDAPLGFLCLVNAARDRPQLPTEADLAALRRSPEAAAFLDGLIEPS